MRKNQIDVIIPTYRPDERVVLLVRRLLKPQTGSYLSDQYSQRKFSERIDGISG